MIPRASTFHLLLRLVVAATLAAAGLGKLFDDSIGFVAPQLLDPEHLLFPVAIAIERAMPLIELVVAGALVTGYGRLAAARILVVLTAGFTTYAVLLPDGARCHCFGLLGGFGNRALHLTVTVALLAAAVVLAIGVRRLGSHARAAGTGSVSLEGGGV